MAPGTGRGGAGGEQRTPLPVLSALLPPWQCAWGEWSWDSELLLDSCKKKKKIICWHDPIAELVVMILLYLAAHEGAGFPCFLE